LKEDLCTIDKRITDRYSRICHGTEFMFEPFGPGKQSYTEGFMPETRATGAFDVHFDFAYGVTVATEKMQYDLEQHHWLDSSSESLWLQAAFLNAQADPPMLGVLEVRFDFERSGGLRKEVRVQTIPAVPYSSTGEYILMLLWIVLIFLLLVRQLFKVARYCTSRSMDKPVMCDIWNIGDWATVVFSFGLAINYNLLSNEMSYTAQQAAKLPEAPSLDVATADVLQLYHESWDRVLDQILDINAWGVANRTLLFAYTLLLTFQFLQVFRGQPKLAELARVLLNSGEDLIHFVCIFLVLFLNFAFGGYMIYGIYLHEWSTGTQAINTSLQIMFGLVDLQRMHAVAPNSTILWFCAFVACMIFIMMNLLLAIACDNFSTVKAHGGTKCGVTSQLSYTWKDMRRRGLLKAFCCCFPCRRCRRDSSLPSHGLMLQELLFRCGFNQKERGEFQGSVIRTQYIKNAAEKAAFAAEGDDADELLQARQQNADADLREMGVDEDYIQGLCVDTKKYMEDEYDFDEQREAQLREIVSVSYDLMTDMRERLTNCQMYAGSEMSGLARRLEALEVIVHRSLEELVKLADGANISTKGQPAPSMKAKAMMDSTVGSLRSLDAGERSRGMMTGNLASIMKGLKGNGGDEDEYRKKKKTTDLASTRTSQMTVLSSQSLKARHRPGSDDDAPPVGASVSHWHQTHRQVGVSGKRVVRSARDEWASK